MAERRPLRAGIALVENADPQKVEAFIRQATPPARNDSPMVAPPSAPVTNEIGRQDVMANTEPVRSARRERRSRPTPAMPIGLIPVTIRLRPEIAAALKRASLERQLAGENIRTQQEIVETALEPWLRSEGVLE